MTEWWQWALAFLGAFLVGLSKTGVAGLGILTVAIFASVLPARESVGVALVVLIAGDVVAVTIYRREASWPHLWRLFPWAALGVGLGALALGSISDAWVRPLIGLILIVLVGVQFWRRRSPASQSNQAPRLWLLAGTGLLAGFTTMLANAAGPIMTIYLLAMRLPKMVFIGTAAWFFLVLNLFKVPFSSSLGLINPESIGISFRLIPLAIVGAIAGRKLITFINQELFETLALLLAFIAGIRLLI